MIKITEWPTVLSFHLKETCSESKIPFSLENKTQNWKVPVKIIFRKTFSKIGSILTERQALKKILALFFASRHKISWVSMMNICQQKLLSRKDRPNAWMIKPIWLFCLFRRRPRQGIKTQQIVRLPDEAAVFACREDYAGKQANMSARTTITTK